MTKNDTVASCCDFSSGLNKMNSIQFSYLKIKLNLKFYLFKKYSCRVNFNIFVLFTLFVISHPLKLNKMKFILKKRYKAQI